jgi:hypothetical protein
MDSRTATAVNELREAVSSYNTYCYFFERGKLLVNADDDPAEIVEAARLNVAERIRVCQSISLTDEAIERILIEANAGLGE